MNVLFVNPPRYNMIRAPQTVDITFLGHRFPPLGLLYVATAVQNHSQHNVELFDFELGARHYDDLIPTLQRFKPDVVGLTTYTYTLYDAYETCKVIRRHCPNAKIVLGGPHAEAYPKETFAQDFVDLVVRGEGEQAMLEVLDYFEGKRELSSIAGVYYRDPAQSGAVVFTGARAPIEDLDSIDIPDRRLLRDVEYYSVLNPGLREATIVSSRGCPHKCNFCSVRSQRYRYRSAKNLVDEMQQCKELGYNNIQFVDDTFNLFGRKVKEVCQEIIDRNLDIGWVFRGRVDQIDAEMTDLLKRANCRRVYFGVESGNAEVLASTQKGVTLSQVRHAFAQMRAAGIETMAYFMIGFPDETPAQMEETMNFAIELDPNFVQVTITVPLPGTPLYDRALAEGGIPGDYFAEYAQNPIRDMRGVPWNKYLSEKQLIAKLKRFYRRFYFRPSYMFKRAAEPKDVREFMRKTGAMLDLARYVLMPQDLSPMPYGQAKAAVHPSRQAA